jgi:hypothetical protein
MKTYTVKTKFVFEGSFKVKAESRQTARRVVENDCGTVMGGNIHTANDEAVIYWDFPIHPQKIIVSVEKRKIKKK